tara:strand:+ start:7739 stop:8896 length:1158 start_codon:yes stop_codon:yes gene_type:complete
MAYLKVENLFDKDLNISSEIRSIINAFSYRNLLINDNLYKTFNIERLNFSKDINKILKTFKNINAENVSLCKSIPSTKKSDYLNDIKTEVKRVLSQTSSNRYYNTYKKQQYLFENISKYNIDSKAINAYLLLESNESLKNNLLGFKNNTNVVYTRTDTTTGRLSSKSQANILTLPRKYRNIFKSSFSKGKILYIDFVSLEPRVMRKIGGFDCSGDIYEEITSNLEIDIDRSIIKQAVISAVYGSSRKALYSKISKDKVDQLCEYIDSFLNAKTCLEMALESSESNCRTNFWGRPIWNKGSSETNVILNNYVQSTAVDIALSGFSSILQKLDMSKVKPLFIIHDALMIDVEENYLNNFVNIVLQGYDCSILNNFPLSVEDLNGTKY